MPNIRLILSLILILVLALTAVGSVAAQGSSRDTDGDGLPDDVDRCPREAGPRSNGGCPETPPEPPRDSDGDGLPDDQDRCPGEAGPRSNNGCPEASPELPPDSGVDQGGDTGTAPAAPVEPGSGAAGTVDGGNAAAEDDSALTAEDSGVTSPPVVLPELPTEGPCVVAPNDPAGTNVRAAPDLTAEIIGGLPASDDPKPVLMVIANQDFYHREYYDVNISEGWAMIAMGDQIGFASGSALRTGGDCGTVPQIPIPFPNVGFSSGETEPIPVALLVPAVQAAHEPARPSSSGAPVPNPDELVAALGPLLDEVPTEDVSFFYHEISVNPTAAPAGAAPPVLVPLPSIGIIMDTFDDTESPTIVVTDTNPMLILVDPAGIAIEPLGHAVLFQGESTPPVIFDSLSPSGEGGIDDSIWLELGYPVVSGPAFLLGPDNLYLRTTPSSASDDGHHDRILLWGVSHDVMAPRDATTSADPGGIYPITVTLAGGDAGIQADRAAHGAIVYCPPIESAAYCLVMNLPSER